MSTARMTWLVGLCLLPAAGWGVFLFGTPALIVLAVSIAAAILAELASTLPFGRFTLRDGSAFLTGFIVGLLMPAGAPACVPAAASAFAILVVKQSFGGLGRNWMNPAMGGVVFALLSWPGPMSQWIAPKGGAVQGAVMPPLEALRAAMAGPGAKETTPLAILSSSGFTFSDLDSQVLGWINTHVFSPMGISLPPGTFDVLIGHVAGGIGIVSVPLLMLGAWFLLFRGIIRWHLPVMYLGTFAILAPDPVTSPMTNKGKCIFGIGLGTLTFFLRFFGSLGDGVAASIVLGNCAAPLLDRWTSRRVTGTQGGAA
jgi:electron transport complex protein RnfD